MSSESDVQLLSEGDGPLVRTRTVTTIIDGVETDVQQQVISEADRDGGIPREPDWAFEMVTELKSIREMLELALAGLKLR